MDEPPGIAQLRAQYAPMTVDQLVAAGFQPDQLYVTAALVGLPAETGAMGYHAINPALLGAQFPQGIMDPLHPPVILLGADRRVIGVEWEAAPRAAAPQLYGQTANLGPVHPGVDQPVACDNRIRARLSRITSPGSPIPSGMMAWCERRGRLARGGRHALGDTGASGGVRR